MRGVRRDGEKRRAPGPTQPEIPDIANHLIYIPETGEFFWKRNGRKAGSEWRMKGDARLVIKFRDRGHQANRVAWLIMTGAFPAHMVDHEDGDGLNNRWLNLRQATHAQNCSNARVRRDNALGLKGVSRRKGRYTARIQANGERRLLGYFKTPEEAHAAYCVAAVELHREFRRVA